MSAARSASWSPDSLMWYTVSFGWPDETEDHPEGPVANGYQRNYVREARADILPSQTTRHPHNVHAQPDHADHVQIETVLKGTRGHRDRKGGEGPSTWWTKVRQQPRWRGHALPPRLPHHVPGPHPLENDPRPWSQYAAGPISTTKVPTLARLLGAKPCPRVRYKQGPLRNMPLPNDPLSERKDVIGQPCHCPVTSFIAKGGPWTHDTAAGTQPPGGPASREDHPV